MASVVPGVCSTAQVHAQVLCNVIIAVCNQHMYSRSHRQSTVPTDLQYIIVSDLA